MSPFRLQIRTSVPPPGPEAELDLEGWPLVHVQLAAVEAEGQVAATGSEAEALDLALDLGEASQQITWGRRKA